jgi:flagellar biosynthesis/type III secretory pathway protein FliH
VVELILSDNVVKQGFTDDYQTWDTPIAGVGVDFAPFFSLTSPAPIVSKDSFAPAEVSVVTQSQAKNEDWQVFNAPHEEASFAAAADNSLGEGELPLSADAIDEDSNDTIHTEAYDAGYQAGYQEAYDKGSALGQSEGEAKGIELGQQQVQALEQQRNEDMQVALGYLSKVTDTLSDELLQPMQTLAVHLAKEIVRGELSLSSHAIERLIRLSMEQLQTTQSSINIHMNPLEFERLQQHNGLPEQVVLQPSNDVSMGSIKVEHAGSWVEDFIEDRLAQISQQVFGAVDEKFIEPLQAITPKVTSEQDTAPEQDTSLEAAPEQDAAPESDTSLEAAPEQDAAPAQDTSLEAALEQDAVPESDTSLEAALEQDAAPAQDTSLEAASEQDAAPAEDTALEAAPEHVAVPESDTSLEVAPEQDAAPAQDTALEAAPEQDAAPESDTSLEAALEQDAAPDLEPSDMTTDLVQQHSTATESPDDPDNNLEGGTTNE